MRPTSCSWIDGFRGHGVDPLTLLIVEDDRDLLDACSRPARAPRGYRTHAVATLAEARRAVKDGPFDLAIVDLTLGSDSGLDAIRAIKERAPDTEIVVISGTTSLASAIASYELKAFAFVPKPFDVEQLFATVERAIEHRRVVAANRRLVWEQRLVNEIGDELRHLLAPEQLVERVLRPPDARPGRRLERGAPAESGNLRVTTCASSRRRRSVRRMWSGPKPAAPRPSDLVLATRAPVRDRRRARRARRRDCGAHARAVRAERADVLRRGPDRRADRRQSRSRDASRCRTSASSASSPTRWRSACRTRGCTPSSAPASRNGRPRSTRWATRSRSSIATGACCAATRRWPRTSGGPSPRCADSRATRSASAADRFRSARSAAPPGAPASTRRSPVPATGSSASRPAPWSTPPTAPPSCRSRRT